MKSAAEGAPLKAQIVPPVASSVDELGRYQRRRRLALGALMTVVFIGLLFVNADGMAGAIHENAERLGAVLIAVTILGRCWCTFYIGGRKGHEIVRVGPYSISRNPLYVFSTIGAAGVGAMTGSVIMVVLFAVLAYVAFHFVILTEEAHLKRVFGDKYVAYMNEVPRFFPNPSLFVDTEMLMVRPHFLYKTLRDAMVFALAYPFFELIESLQDSGVLPVLLHLY